jgi:hypothetical protein
MLLRDRVIEPFDVALLGFSTRHETSHKVYLPVFADTMAPSHPTNDYSLDN